MTVSPCTRNKVKNQVRSSGSEETERINYNDQNSGVRQDTNRCVRLREPEAREKKNRPRDSYLTTPKQQRVECQRRDTGNRNEIWREKEEEDDI